MPTENKKHPISSLAKLRDIILKAKNEEAAFEALNGHPTTIEISDWFSDEYGKQGFYRLSSKKAFSNLYFDVINDLI